MVGKLPCWTSLGKPNRATVGLQTSWSEGKGGILSRSGNSHKSYKRVCFFKTQTRLMLNPWGLNPGIFSTLPKNPLREGWGCWVQPEHWGFVVSLEELAHYFFFKDWFVFLWNKKIINSVIQPSIKAQSWQFDHTVLRVSSSEAIARMPVEVLFNPQGKEVKFREWMRSLHKKAQPRLRGSGPNGCSAGHSGGESDHQPSLVLAVVSWHFLTPLGRTTAAISYNAGCTTSTDSGILGQEFHSPCPPPLYSRALWPSFSLISKGSVSDVWGQGVQRKTVEPRGRSRIGPDSSLGWRVPWLNAAVDTSAAIHNADNMDSFGLTGPWECRLLTWANSAKARVVGYCLKLGTPEGLDMRILCR